LVDLQFLGIKKKRIKKLENQRVGDEKIKEKTLTTTCNMVIPCTGKLNVRRNSELLTTLNPD